MDYVRDPAAIYAQSFATIRAEADLSRVPDEAQDLAIRLIHAAGMVDLVDDLAVAPGAVAAGRAALLAGAPVICDVEMVRHGIMNRLLPKGVEVVTGIGQADAAELARVEGNTRSAGGMVALQDRMGGAVVAIGNAPTALFRLLEGLDAGWAKPALILGFPVGFVGAAESKAELIANARGVPFVALKGRRGGSALAAAAVNALAGGLGA